MSRQQLGHGPHRGIELGENFGRYVGMGEQDAKVIPIADHIITLSHALQQPAEDGRPRNETWLALYAYTIGKQIEALAKQLPSTLGGLEEMVLEEETVAKAPAANDLPA